MAGTGGRRHLGDGNAPLAWAALKVVPGKLARALHLKLRLQRARIVIVDQLQALADAEFPEGGED